MSVFWLNILGTATIVLTVIFGPIIVHGVRDGDRQIKEQRMIRIVYPNVWRDQLTDDDRAWFMAHLWDGTKVLDEPKTPLGGTPALPGKREPIQIYPVRAYGAGGNGGSEISIMRPVKPCNHEHYLEMRAVFEPETSCFCADCGAEL